MKPIQAVDVWVNGTTIQATQLTLTLVYDNLSTEGVFQYHLSDGDNNSLIEGKLPISGTDYETWGQSLDANADAYVFAANQLNLTLI